MASQLFFPCALARLSWTRRPSARLVRRSSVRAHPPLPTPARRPHSHPRGTVAAAPGQRLGGPSRSAAASERSGGDGAGESYMELLPVGDGTSFHLQALMATASAGHAPAIRLPANEDAYVVLGRRGGGKADLEMDVASLSASHAALTVSRGRLFITDLGSTNGTRVDGRSLRRGEETRLRDGQVVILGDEHLAAFEVAGAGGGGGVLGALSGLLPSRNATAESTSPSLGRGPQSSAPNSSVDIIDDQRRKATTGAAAQSRQTALAGKVAGAVVRGMPDDAGRQAEEVVIAAAESGWTAQGDDLGLTEINRGVDDDEAGQGKGGGLIETPSTSSVEVVPENTDEGRAVKRTAGSGEVAERGGPWGALAEVTGRLGASISNSQVQVNYQYRPVVQFNTGGKPLGPGELKSALLVAIAGKARGRKASERDVEKIEQLARALEAVNPTRAPLRSPLLNGRWALQYTTCKATLGGNGIVAPSGAIHQTVDIFNLKVLNESTFEPLPFLKWTNASSGSLSAKSESRAAVQPEQFRVGPFKMRSPPKSPGRAAMEWEARAMGASSEAWLDTSYLDADTRISRNSNGELFVFTRDDPNDD